MGNAYQVEVKLNTIYKKLNSRICKLEANGGSGSAYTYIVDTYNDLLLEPNPQINEFAYVKISQGTAWLPGGLGGTYYPSGTWFYTGTEWINDKSQIAAQLQININDIVDIENELLALTTTVNNHVTDLNNPHQTPVGPGGGDLITDVIVDDSIDFIYRGFNRNGAWEIERFNIEDINIKLVATELNNGIYTTLANAWTNRAILNYI